MKEKQAALYETKGEEEEKSQQAQADLRDALRRYAETRPELMRIQDEITAARHAVQNAERRVGEAQNTRTDALQAYGNNIRQLLQAIGRESRWHGIRPVGPIGSYVKLRDANWSMAIESVLSQILGGFVISDRRDRTRLAQLFNQHRM